MYKARQIRIDQIDPSWERLRRPVAGDIGRMATSLKAKGQLTPVIVIQGRHQFALIDGFKRYRAALQLGVKHLKGLILDLATPRAKAMIYLLNRSGGFSLIQEALLIRELVDSDGLNQSEAAVLLERHKSWVSRRLTIIRRLAPEIIDEMSLKLIEPGSARSLARLPPCNQTEFAAAIKREKLAAREIAQLVDLFVKANDPGVRKHIVMAPRDVLEALNQKKKSSISPGDILKRLNLTFKMLEKALGPAPINTIRTGLYLIRSGLNMIAKSYQEKQNDTIEHG